MIDLTCELTDEQKGMIALKLLRREMRQNGIRLKHGNIHRNVGRLAKELDIPVGQMRAFANSMVSEMLEAALNPPPRQAKQDPK